MKISAEELKGEETDVAEGTSAAEEKIADTEE